MESRKRKSTNWRSPYRKKNRKTYNFGILSEKIVMIFLRLKLYRILQWRYRSPFGEIDIIAKKSKTIIIVEVKARRSKVLTEEVLRPKQIRRLKNSAEFFVAKNPEFHNHNLRFDLVEVTQFLLPKHRKNFF